MKVEPGDKLEILLTHNGVPYAKTFVFDVEFDLFGFIGICANMADSLISDIEEYGDEEGIENSKRVEDSKEDPQGHV